MKKMLHNILLFASGLFVGMLLAQCFIVLAARAGGSFGGEVFPLLAFPLVIGTAYTIGRDQRRAMDYAHGFEKGYHEGADERAAAAK